MCKISGSTDKLSIKSFKEQADAEFQQNNLKE